MFIYLAKFSIYTMAMIGAIFAALFVFKKFSACCISKKASMLSLEDSMKLSPKKSLHIINVGGEKFLIASDIDNTSLIAKLNTKTGEIKAQAPAQPPKREDKSTKLSSFDGVKSLNDFTTPVIDFPQRRNQKQPVMRELARKLASSK